MIANCFQLLAMILPWMWTQRHNGLFSISSNIFWEQMFDVRFYMCIIVSLCVCVCGWACFILLISIAGKWTRYLLAYSLGVRAITYKHVRTFDSIPFSLISLLSMVFDFMSLCFQSAHYLLWCKWLLAFFICSILDCLSSFCGLA